MKFPKITTSVVGFALAGLTLAGCSSSGLASTSSDAGQISGSSSSATGDYAQYADVLADNQQSHADSNDADYDASEASTITLADEDVTISEPGSYILTGTLTDHSVTIDSAAEGKVKLVLDGVTMTSSVNSPIIVTAADEVVLILADGSTNTITDTSAHTAAESDSDATDAAIFSMADLTIGGSGTLEVNATATGVDGIGSKDGLVILSGSISVAAGDDGIRGKDYVIVSGGTIDVTSTQDGLKSTNEDDDTVGFIYLTGGTVTIDAGDDGAHAEGDLLLSGGELTINGSSEGLEGANIVIAGGTSKITSSDDGVNATQSTANEAAQAGDPGTDSSAIPQDGAMPQGGTPPQDGTMPQDGGGQGGGMVETSDGSQLIITGGELTIDAEGDGIDSNGTVTMSGGTVIVHGPTNNGNGALDTTSFDISGGTLIAAGSTGMAVAPTTASTQGWVMLNQTLSAGQSVELLDGDTVLATYTAAKSVGNIVISVPDLSSGSSYTVQVDGSDAGTVTADAASAGTGGGMGQAPSGQAGQR